MVREKYEIGDVLKSYPSNWENPRHSAVLLIICKDTDGFFLGPAGYGYFERFFRAPPK